MAKKTLVEKHLKLLKQLNAQIRKHQDYAYYWHQKGLGLLRTQEEYIRWPRSVRPRLKLKMKIMGKPQLDFFTRKYRFHQNQVERLLNKRAVQYPPYEPVRMLARDNETWTWENLL